MNTILLTAGVVALLAAVLGGGLKAFNIEMPVLTSGATRVALGVLGVIFLVAAFVLRDGAGGKSADEARYQRDVAATCNAVLRLMARGSAGTPQIDPRSLDPSGGGGFDTAVTYSRGTLLSGERSKQTAIHRRFDLLLEKREPSSLRDEADALRRAVNNYVDDESAFRERLTETLPERPTLQDLTAASEEHQEQADEDRAQLEEAMTQLGDKDCSLSST